MTDHASLESFHLEVRDLALTLGQKTVFEGLSCAFVKGKISVVLGSSGSGKSTLLRAICRLLRADRGEIWVEGKQEIGSLSERELQEHRRRIGMMFQGGALLDAWTVFDNVAFPLREHTSMDETEIQCEVESLFESVGLEGVNGLLPGELSGGMLKRAALARALILEPEILLCDEPFSGLDPSMVRLVEALLVKVNLSLGITMIITSHHIGTTLRMADWVVLLSDGGCISGTPEELKRSNDPRVTAFFSTEEPIPDAARTERWQPGFGAHGSRE